MYHKTTICLLLIIKCATSLYQVHELPQRTRFARLSDNQVRHLQRQGFGPTTSSFRPTTPVYHQAYEQDDGDSYTAPSEHLQTRAVGDENYPIRNTIPGPPPRPLHKLHAQYQQRPDHELERRLQTKDGKGKVPKEEEEIEEPDRLSLLLPDSKFDCVGKNTGYYADDGLGCEVFHYCHDNARHSWICPDGFTFHQVHLICMPPSKDNICEHSSKYHFVNEYLYRPVNLEEHQHKPNITLKYAERYYPESHYQNEHEHEEQQQTRQSNQPIRVSLEQHPGPQVSHQQVRRPQQPTSGYRPQTTIGQVFRSPEEVNISLQQRRPAYVTQRYQLDQDFF